MLSKKQSLAPTIPPPEVCKISFPLHPMKFKIQISLLNQEQRPKLDMVLVEHASLMKGAIPVLPVYLAYFCLVCNVITPGLGELVADLSFIYINFSDRPFLFFVLYAFLGTIFSGLFCLCIGVPRFSQHDGARGRIGSFIINTIVGISQAFTIIFCFVGWGWSIWWGTIMLNVASKYFFRGIKAAELVDLEFIHNCSTLRVVRERGRTLIADFYSYFVTFREEKTNQTSREAS